MTKTVTLGEICGINPESITKNYPYSEILYFDTASVTKGVFDLPIEIRKEDAPSRAKRVIRDKDILISTVRPNLQHYGLVKRPAENAVASTGFAVIRTKNQEVLDSEYLYYWLTTDEKTKFLSSVADQAVSTYPAFNPTIISDMEIDLPDIAEQKRIAGILGSLDEKIEFNRAQIQTLESLASALFQKTFVQSPEAKSWKIGIIGDLSDIATGKGGVKTVAVIGGTKPVYGANGIMGYTDKALFKERVIITGRVGTLGQVRVINDEAWFSDNVLIFTPKSKNFYFVYFTLTNLDWNSLNRGSSQPLVTQGSIKSQEVTTPDSQTLTSFDVQVSPLFAQIDHLEKENQTLAKTRDSLLVKLII